MTWSKVKETLTTTGKSTKNHRHMQLGSLVTQSAETTAVVAAPTAIAIPAVIAASFVELAISVYALFFRDIKPSEMFIEGLEALFASPKLIIAIILYFQDDDCD
jgi:hypothetical protein